MRTTVSIALCLIFAPILSIAQETPIPPDSVLQEPETDTLAITDTAVADSIENSKNGDAPGDTTLAALPPIEPFRFSSAVARRLLHASRISGSRVSRAVYHDAGDFFRIDRNFFTVDYQTTPLRHTVSPFTLSGQRVSVIFDGRSLSPVEHIVEQDGQIDFNDIPTASVSDIHTITGPLGAFLGGQSGVAGIWMDKVQGSAGEGSRSRLEIQKGSFGYSYTKGILTEKLPNGYSYTAALGYRKADFFSLLDQDDSYHQFWEFTAPLKRKWRLTNSVRLYRRRANYVYRPSTAAVEYDRSRRDLDLTTLLEHTPDLSLTYSAEFRRQRNESVLERVNIYKRDLKHDENSINLRRDQRFDRGILSVGAKLIRERTEFESAGNSRSRGSFSMRALIHNRATGTVAVQRNAFVELGLEGAGGYSVLPKVNAGIFAQSKSLEFSLALGATPVFPSQYDLDLPLETPTNLSGVDALQQSGNPALIPEKQYTASVNITLGNARNNLALTATGGHLKDAVNWRAFDLSGGDREFRPINEDVDFAGLTMRSTVSLADWLYWINSATYYSVLYQRTDTPPLSPDFNLFTALKVDYYLRPLELYLTGYGELSGTGIYTGYDGRTLGEDPVFNVRLSGRVKSFTFHYVFENALNRNYQARDQYFFPGRYNWYWITWDFAN